MFESINNDENLDNRLSDPGPMPRHPAPFTLPTKSWISPGDPQPSIKIEKQLGTLFFIHSKSSCQGR